jgi:mRNA interferase RelE/StbE
MPYQVILSPAAARQLRKLPPSVIEKIETHLLELEDNPRPAGCKKLTGFEAWRIRVGNYRVIYEIKDSILLVSVIAIGDRKEIY